MIQRGAKKSLGGLEPPLAPYFPHLWVQYHTCKTSAYNLVRVARCATFPPNLAIFEVLWRVKICLVRVCWFLDGFEKIARRILKVFDRFKK